MRLLCLQTAIPFAFSHMHCCCCCCTVSLLISDAGDRRESLAKTRTSHTRTDAHGASDCRCLSVWMYLWMCVCVCARRGDALFESLHTHTLSPPLLCSDCERVASLIQAQRVSVFYSFTCPYFPFCLVHDLLIVRPCFTVCVFGKSFIAKDWCSEQKGNIASRARESVSKRGGT